MATMLLAQTADMLETAKAVGGLPTSAVLALVVAGLVWDRFRLEARLEKALASNDGLQDARVADLKQTIKDLSSTSKEAA